MNETAGARSRVAMIVDDDLVLRTIAAEALRAIDFEIVEVDSGEEALASLEQTLPDLVLLDLHLPGMDGYAVCKQMRRHPALAETPILIMTGSAEGKASARAFEAGASDFIKKPIDWKLIQHRASTLVEASTLSEDLQNTRNDLQQSKNELEATREIGRLGSWEIDLDTGVVLWSSELRLLVGWSSTNPEPMQLEDMSQLLPGEERPLLHKAIRSVAETGNPEELEHRLIDAKGRTHFVSQRIVASEGLLGQRQIRGTVQDMTQQRRAEARAQYLETFDSVTRLHNRTFMQRRLAEGVQHCQSEGLSLAVLCLDLHRFHRINQAFGHDAGDRLLRAVGDRLLRLVQGTEFVGRIDEQPNVVRMGGNEFSVVLSGVLYEATARQAAGAILDSFDEPFTEGEQRITLSASVGIATLNVMEHEGSPDHLLSHSSLAMVWAKQSGGGGYRFFDPAINSKHEMQLTLEADLNTALAGEGLVLEYQPQCDAATGTPVAVEALVRWNHPRLGRLMPGDFIPVAESSGLAGALSEWVLHESCRQIQEWDAAGLPPLRIGANVSSVQFEGGRVVDTVRSALDAHGVEPSRIEIEITETALLGDGAEVARTCDALRALGVSLALDDFGTGFSSLSHLFRFQIDVLKIDRSFTAEIRASERARAIIAAMIAMSHRLGITVIAEGVEEPEESDYMRDEGCDLLQGFGICRPALPDAVASWVRGQLVACTAT